MTHSEWERFVDLAEREARTIPGKAKVQLLKSKENWAKNVQQAQELQDQTHEVLALLGKTALWSPLVGLESPDTALEALDKDRVLELGEFQIIRTWLLAVDSWQSFPQSEISGRRFSAALEALMTPTEPLRVLDRILTPEGELSEKASPKLAGLFQSIRAMKKNLSERMDQIVEKLWTDKILQEKFIDVRDGRYVVPVKISEQFRVSGIAHDASASRQTVFVEPDEIVILNNQLKQKENELLQETYEILKETSAFFQDYREDIEASVELIAVWDGIQARARLGLHYGGHSLQVTEDRVLCLYQTAHPLLWWSLDERRITRNDLVIEPPKRALMISGPNTGGKTVLMKTIGMAGMCARTGFSFPGSGSLIVPFFDQFFIDVGDSQSIEDQLSTFSGHVARFKEILEGMSHRSLILIDELSTATDPEEGSALGRAILETLLSDQSQQGAMLIVTTHDPGLKSLGLTDERILNAGMMFDEEGMEPTYRIHLGVPGRSRALEIASRLGLSESVLTLAKSYLSKSHVEFEKLLEKIERDHASTLRAKHEAERLKEEAERLKQEWLGRMDRDVGDMLGQSRHKLKQILFQAQDELREALKKSKESDSKKGLERSGGKLDQVYDKFTEKIEKTLFEEAPEVHAILEKESKSKVSASPASSELVVGSIVRVPKWRNIGTIVEMHKGKIKVSMGGANKSSALAVTLSPQDVELLSEEETQKIKGAQAQATRSKSVQTVVEDVPLSLDLRGVRYEDAVALVQQYLDRAYSHRHREVTIVHGLGTGALREGTLQVLKQLPYVKKYYDGGTGRGGSGATIVEFDLD